MVVTVSLGGHPVDLQFDTGSDVSSLYRGVVAERLGPQVKELPSGHSGVQAPVMLADIDLAEQTFYLLPRPEGRVAGRLGLESLLGRIIQIDYPQRRLCQLDEQQFQAMVPRLLMTPARIRSKKLFVYAELNGQYWPGLFFDSGASLYALLVDKQQWQHLTGRQGAEADNHYLRGWSHSQLITTVGAPLLEKVSLAGIALADTVVHYTLERPRHFANYPVAATGLVGNALFFEDIVVLDLRQEDAWFGVLRK